MDTNFFSGRLLVATPRITGAEFARTVVLLLNHDEEGAHGVVLNRPMEAPVSTVLPSWQPLATAPARVFQGGPVGLDTAVGLVSVPGEGSDGLGLHPLFGSVALVDLDMPPEVVAAELGGLRIFVGYAGWAAGQLEGELADHDWVVVEAEPRDPFTDSPEELWTEVLRRQRSEVSFLVTATPDPTLN